MHEVFDTDNLASRDHLENYDGGDENTLIGETITEHISEKHCAVWNTRAVAILLKLYENKFKMLESPKKKTRIWTSISDTLKEYNIVMSPDQVRWKINALTKIYKQCLFNGRHDKFKYFNILNNINSRYNASNDSNTIIDLMNRKSYRYNNISSQYLRSDLNTTIEMRKIRLANRIECDRSQGKIQLEKQWLEYLKKQEEERQWRDEMFERHLKLQEQELELRKRNLELKQELEYKKIQLMEKDIENMLQIKVVKCELL